jgi:hypothetical protein
VTFFCGFPKHLRENSGIYFKTVHDHFLSRPFQFITDNRPSILGHVTYAVEGRIVK